MRIIPNWKRITAYGKVRYKGGVNSMLFDDILHAMARLVFFCTAKPFSNHKNKTGSFVNFEQIHKGNLDKPVPER